eukprot:6463146-Amphidinium_carterae.1
MSTILGLNTIARNGLMDYDLQTSYSQWLSRTSWTRSCRSTTSLHWQPFLLEGDRVADSL